MGRYFRLLPFAVFDRFSVSQLLFLFSCVFFLFFYSIPLTLSVLHSETPCLLGP